MLRRRRSGRSGVALRSGLSDGVRFVNQFHPDLLLLEDKIDLSLGYFVQIVPTFGQKCHGARANKLSS